VPFIKFFLGILYLKQLDGMTDEAISINKVNLVGFYICISFLDVLT
jgi:hypothetical protein